MVSALTDARKVLLTYKKDPVSLDRLDLGYSMQMFYALKVQIKHISDVYSQLRRDESKVTSSQIEFEVQVNDVMAGMISLQVSVESWQSKQAVSLWEMETLNLGSSRKSNRNEVLPHRD